MTYEQASDIASEPGVGEIDAPRWDADSRDDEQHESGDKKSK
jgi:hypothetical protein